MDIDYNKLIEAMVAKMTTTKTVSSTPSTIMGHGNGGLFSYPGMERPIFSAMLLPQMGLQSLLPVKPTVSENPVFGILTGVTATTGDEPSGVCDDPPTAGLTKLCKHSFTFGRQSRQTRVFDLDRFGKIANRADFMDFQVFGNPFNGAASANNPTIPGMDFGNVANNEIAKALFELAVAWSRDFAQELYSGNPVNNSAAGGRKYFYGLDILINTGYVDAETNVICPAADSIVRSFGDLNVATSTQTAIDEITYIWRNLNYISRVAGLSPASWVLAMRYGLFYELTSVWPCEYLSYRCHSTDTSAIDPVGSYDSAQAVKMRDAMRAGLYLTIDGVDVPVVLDEAIAETEPAAGVFESTVYFVPLRVLNNIPVTYIEHFDYSVAGGAIDAARAFAPDGSFYASDNGRFLWHKKPPTNFCVQVLAKTEPRLLLLTPHLAGRLTDVRYTPLIHERESFTSSGYFVNGGGTSRQGYGPSLYDPDGEQ